MLTFSAPQQTARDSASKSISWLFEVLPVGWVTPLYWSTKDVSFGGHDYVFGILPDSFSGVRMPRARTEGGIRNPAAANFSAIFGGTDYVAILAAAIGGTVTIRLVINEVEMRSWRMTVKGCTFVVGALQLSCEDFLQHYLDGDFPNTPLISDLDPSFSLDDITGQPTDKLTCVPIIIGAAFIPLELIMHSGARYYLLGVDGVYSISEVRSPKDWGSNSAWLASEFGMTLGSITVDGAIYQTLQPIINDSNGDTIADAMGFWAQSNGFMAMPTQYSWAATVSLTNPADSIQQFLLYIGLPAGDIDSASFAAAHTLFDTLGISFNGGWSSRETRQAVLASLLNQCGGTIDVRDKVYLRVARKESVVSISNTDILRTPQGTTSFSYTPTAVNSNDSGYIMLSLPDTPSDRTTTITCPADTTKTNPASQTLTMNLVHDSVVAQKLGRLYYRRALMAIASPVWQQKLSGLGIQPDDVVTVSHDNYGGSYPVLVDEITINRQGSIQIHAISYAVPFENFEDITGISAVTVEEYDPTGAWRVDNDALATAAIDVAAVTSFMDGILADDTLTNTEMRNYAVGWHTLTNSYAKLSARAVTLGVLYPAFTTAMNTLGTLLNGGVDWVVGSADPVAMTEVWLADFTEAPLSGVGIAVDFRAYTMAAITQNAALEDAVKAAEEALILTAQDTIDIWASDSYFDTTEKASARPAWDIVAADYQRIIKTAYDLGVITTSYTTAFNEYGTYLNAGTYTTGVAVAGVAPLPPVPAWLGTSIAVDTPIVRTTFQQQFAAYAQALVTIELAIATSQKSLSNAAQTTANTANSAAGTAQATATTANTAAATAQATANVGSAHATTTHSPSNADNTATILSASGTSITVTSSSLFQTAASGARVFIGAGGLYAKNASNVTTFSLTAATGVAYFAGDIGAGSNIDVTGYVKATGSTTFGVTSAAVVGATSAVLVHGGYFTATAGSTSGVYGKGYYGATGESTSVSGAGVIAIAYSTGLALQAGKSSLGATTLTSLTIAGGPVVLGGGTVTGGASGIIIGTHLTPGVNDTSYCGSSTKYWNYVYGNHIRYKDVATFDKYDDLAILDAIQPIIGLDGKPKDAVRGYEVDPTTIHDVLTNRAEIINDIRRQRRNTLADKLYFHDLVSDKMEVTVDTLADTEIGDIEYEIDLIDAMPLSMLTDYHAAIAEGGMYQVTPTYRVDTETLKSMEFNSLGAMVAMAQGGVRQLNKETTLLVENLNALIEDLVGRVKKLERGHA